MNPPPTRRIPILIGGTGPRKTLRMVAEHADGWHAAFPDDPADLEPKVEALRRWCAEFERNPAEIEWGLGLQPGRSEFDRQLAQVDDYVDMGFTQFTLGFNGPGWDLSIAADWLAWRDERTG